MLSVLLPVLYTRTPWSCSHGRSITANARVRFVLYSIDSTLCAAEHTQWYTHSTVAWNWEMRAIDLNTFRWKKNRICTVSNSPLRHNPTLECTNALHFCRTLKFLFLKLLLLFTTNASLKLTRTTDAIGSNLIFLYFISNFAESISKRTRKLTILKAQKCWKHWKKVKTIHENQVSGLFKCELNSKFNVDVEYGMHSMFRLLFLNSLFLKQSNDNVLTTVCSCFISNFDLIWFQVLPITHITMPLPTPWSQTRDLTHTYTHSRNQ